MQRIKIKKVTVHRVYRENTLEIYISARALGFKLFFSATVQRKELEQINGLQMILFLLWYDTAANSLWLRYYHLHSWSIEKCSLSSSLLDLEISSVGRVRSQWIITNNKTLSQEYLYWKNTFPTELSRKLNINNTK